MPNIEEDMATILLIGGMVCLTFKTSRCQYTECQELTVFQLSE